MAETESISRSIILLQYLKNKDSFGFESTISKIISDTKNVYDVFFSLDNFSDSLTSGYAVQLMDRSSKSLIVCDLGNTEKPSRLLNLLNQAIKKPNVKIFSIGENKVIQPFVSLSQGKIIDPTELKELIKA